MVDITLYILSCIALLLVQLIVLVCELTEWVKLQIKTKRLDSYINTFRTSGYICTEGEPKAELRATTYTNAQGWPLLPWRPVDNGNDAPPPPPTTGSNVHDVRRQKCICFRCGQEIAEGYICPACLEDD